MHKNMKSVECGNSEDDIVRGKGCGHDLKCMLLGSDLVVTSKKALFYRAGRVGWRNG